MSTHRNKPEGEKKKIIRFAFLLAMMLFMILPLVNAVSWWNTSYAYRKQINITNNNATANLEQNYSIKFILNTTGSKFMNSGNDTRIVYWNGSTNVELDRVNETAFNSSTTNIWFKLQANVSAGGNDSNYYVYYGNPTAGAPPTNKSKVYDFFDDFSGNLSQWVVDTENTDAAYVNYSVGNPSPSLQHINDSSQTKNAYNDTRLRTKSYQFKDGIIEYDLYLNGSSRSIHQFGLRVSDLNFSSGYAWRLQTSGADGGWFMYTGVATWSTFGAAYNVTTTGNWHHVVLNVSGPNFNATVDGGSVYSGYNTTKLSAGYLVSHVHATGRNFSDLVDNIKVRKFMTAEPTAALLGSEENNTAPSINFTTSTTSQGVNSQSWIAANVTASSGLLDKIKIYLYNSTGSLINSTTSSSSPLYINFSGLAEGNYYLNATANDTRAIINSTGTRNITLDLPPTISLESPNNNVGDADGNITLRYNVTENMNVTNCSLIINSNINQTNSSITKDQSINFSLSNLPAGSYDWSINCTNEFGAKGSSQTRHFGVIIATSFGGQTTNLSAVDISNITNLTLDNPGYGKIVFNGSLNLSNGTNINSAVTIQQNVLVNSTAEPRLNRSATIYLYNLLYVFTPVILRDNQLCSDCIVSSYNQGNLSFSVPHFSNYTTATNSQLVIWDDTDSDRRQPDEAVNFYANYTNRTSGAAISGVNDWCQIVFNDSSPQNMIFNPTSNLYEYQRTFSYPGTSNYNVTCNATAQGFEVLNLTDAVGISDRFYGPRNNYNQYYVRTKVNVTSALPEILNITCNNGAGITLNAGTTKQVFCSILVRDYRGGDTITNVNSTYYYYLNQSSDPDENNTHYTNSSCTHNNTDGYNTTWDCAFGIWYYANNGTWMINSTTIDDNSFTATNTSNTSILPLYAINVTDLIDFGSVYVSNTSPTVQANVTNLGNMNISINVYAFGGNNPITGAGLAMICEQRNLTLSNERYSVSASDSYDIMTPVTGTPATIAGLTIMKQITPSVQNVNSTYWKLYVNQTTNPFGICNGTVVFAGGSA